MPNYLVFRCCVFYGVFFNCQECCFCSFSVWTFQSVFLLKPMFSKEPAFSEHFVGNHGAPIFCLQLVALPASATMSLPANITKNLNMLGLNILVLVFQISNSFNLIAFSFFRQFLSSCFSRRPSIVTFGGRVFHWLFLKPYEFCLCSFFRLKSSNCFPVQVHVFEKSFIFCTSVCSHFCDRVKEMILWLPP